ncbi:hypothetical protein EB118_10830 [bacterium]|nr:hypothetical protein [bacterium]
MTLKQPSSFFGVLTGIGAAASIGAAWFQPTAFAPILAASGGVLFGASVLSEKKRQEENEITEATNVASNFSRLYDTNRGIVSAEQLAITSNVNIDRINEFLGRLVEEQKGHLINTEKGTVYSFPHPAHVLNELTNNAKNWAFAQQEQLLQQINTLQQQTAVLIAQQASMRVPLQPLVQDQQPLKNSEVAKPGGDLWDKLL